MQLVPCCGVDASLTQELREELFERKKKKSFPIYHLLEIQQKAAERQAVGG